MRRLILISLIVALVIVPVFAVSSTWSGERNLGQEYIFTVNNVSGLNQSARAADVTYHISVYDYRIVGSYYHYYSVSWGQWFLQEADDGKKYLAIWVRSEMTGNTSWYGWGPDRFRVWVYGNTTAYNQSTPMQDIPIEYRSDIYRPAVIQELQDLKDRERSRLTSEWYGWKDEVELDRQEPGDSARWDGVMLYQIPQEATADDIRVVMQSWYGYGVWYLTPHDRLRKVAPTPISTMEKQNVSAVIVRGGTPIPTVNVR